MPRLISRMVWKILICYLYMKERQPFTNDGGASVKKKVKTNLKKKLIFVERKVRGRSRSQDNRYTWEMRSG